jgi:hypothetical protein
MYSFLVAGLTILFFAIAIAITPGFWFFLHLPSIVIFIIIIVLTLLSFSWQRVHKIFILTRKRSFNPQRANALLTLLDDVDRHGRLLLEFAALMSFFGLFSFTRAVPDADITQFSMGIVIALLPVVYALLFRSLFIFPFTNHLRKSLLKRKLEEEESGSGLDL